MRYSIPPQTELARIADRPTTANGHCASRHTSRRPCFQGLMRDRCITANGTSRYGSPESRPSANAILSGIQPALCRNCSRKRHSCKRSMSASLISGLLSFHSRTSRWLWLQSTPESASGLSSTRMRLFPSHIKWRLGPHEPGCLQAVPCLVTIRSDVVSHITC
jgi:hypothetical protein